MSINYTYATPEEEDHFLFLDQLQKEGKTNMLGSSSHLAEKFKVSKGQARNIVAKWITTYSQRH